ncbi:MAG: ribosomal protein S18-alanine N-acetyltransferase [Deltaproteobacteria bacterium]|nr:ribosomal protein S18-alanine N-acetyltransferase [Deltaproteobacteria bacterium]
MDDDIIIDDLTSHDLHEVIEIENTSTPTPWPRALFEKELDHRHSTNLAARVLSGNKRTLVGYIVYWTVADESHLFKVAVHPEMRRKGIGRALVEEAVKRGRKGGVKKVFLEVRRSNGSAIALYEILQFKKVGERKAYYQDGEDAIVMALAL